MNVFVLDTDPVLAARYHNDKHVVKMCCEYAQILCTASRLMGHHHDGYRNTHAGHPCVQWATHPQHWAWLYKLAIELGAEYTRRYGRVHKSTEILSCLPYDLRAASFYLKGTPKAWAFAMPEQYIDEDDVVGSYRAYYLGEKVSFCKWKAPAEVPEWFTPAGSLL